MLFCACSGPRQFSPKGCTFCCDCIRLNFILLYSVYSLTRLCQAHAFHYDPKGLIKKWDHYHVTVWGGMVGMAEASHEHAVARCVQGPDGVDVGKKSFNTTGGRSRHLEEYEGRRNILAITFTNKDGSVRTVPKMLRHTCSAVQALLPQSFVELQCTDDLPVELSRSPPSTFLRSGIPIRETLFPSLQFLERSSLSICSCTRDRCSWEKSA
jgi:hypothetical protein